jgi:hypothetical protein
MRNILIPISLFSLLFLGEVFSASKRSAFIGELHYKTVFNKCPSKVGGKLTLILMKEFEKNKSLKDVKEKIVTEKLDQKYFLSDYKITFDPLLNRIKFDFQCPDALMKVQIYKKNGDEFYTAILVDNGDLVDPTYEVLLRGEKKLKGKLPELAVPVTVLDSKGHLEITKLVANMAPDFRKKISEVIINDNKELTIILSLNKRAASVFMGKDYWSEKVEKLVKVITYLKKKKTIPAIINLTNSKKIVVKFSDTL